MLVDLERNDRPGVPYGNVKVDEFMVTERYSRDPHRLNIRLRDSLRGSTICAVFPGGTITGVPKIAAWRSSGDRTLARGSTPDRSATLVVGRHGLEHRDPYAGQRGEVSLHAGAGIVADSDLTGYSETLYKARPCSRRWARRRNSRVWAYVNRVHADHEAAVSVHDRGFQYGDGVFDTLRV
jgi:hypothetical protein